MRGIEGALYVLGQVRERHAFASEALRKLGETMRGEDLSLASSLVYGALRRREMWRVVFEGYLKKGNRDSAAFPPLVQDCLLVGTAGLLELRRFAGGVLVNALLDCLKEKSLRQWVPLVNAVLHSVGERGAERVETLRRSPSLEERALWAGIPVWSLPAWTKTWQRADMNRLFELLPRQPASALRLSPGVDREGLIARLDERGVKAAPSEFSGSCLRLDSSVLPREVPGFDEGLCTVQSEGSILAASLAGRFYRGGLVLDLCCGRGVKAGQILQSCPEARLEGWELSERRHKSALRELERLGLSERATLRQGSALELAPQEAPSMILLDAPCSGSGTWSRKPESKWRLDWDRLNQLGALQRKLLERAVELCAPGGTVLYVTCSLLRQENENVVAETLTKHPECADVPIPWAGGPFHRGRPWGTYIWPENPWMDGFYCAVIAKKLGLEG